MSGRGPVEHVQALLESFGLLPVTKEPLQCGDRLTLAATPEEHERRKLGYTVTNLSRIRQTQQSREDAGPQFHVGFVNEDEGLRLTAPSCAHDSLADLLVHIEIRAADE